MRKMLKPAALLATCAFVLTITVGCSKPSATDTSENTSAAETKSDDTATSETKSDDAPKADEQQSDTEATTSDSIEIMVDDAIDLIGQDVFVVEGTVRVVSAEELVELQKADIDPAMAGNGGTYAVLVFDEPTEVDGMSGDGTGGRTETANMLGIAEYTEYDSFTIDKGDLDSWRAYDGKHVTLAAKAEDIMFPSDVRLPLGEPATGEAVVLS